EELRAGGSGGGLTTEGAADGDRLLGHAGLAEDLFAGGQDRPDAQGAAQEVRVGARACFQALAEIPRRVAGLVGLARDLRLDLLQPMVVVVHRAAHVWLGRVERRLVPGEGE